MSRLRHPWAVARGLGSAKEGVAHWWAQRVSAAALLFLVPFVLGLPYLLALGNGHAAQLWNWKEEGGEEVDFSFSGLVSSLLGETVSGLLGLEVKKKGD